MTSSLIPENDSDTACVSAAKRHCVTTSFRGRLGPHRRHARSRFVTALMCFLRRLRWCARFSIQKAVFLQRRGVVVSCFDHDSSPLCNLIRKWRQLCQRFHSSSAAWKRALLLSASFSADAACERRWLHRFLSKFCFER